MASLENIAKTAAAALDGISKSVGSLRARVTKSLSGLFIQTDGLDFILVGQNEDEVLVWGELSEMTNVLKS